MPTEGQCFLLLMVTDHTACVIIYLNSDVTLSLKYDITMTYHFGGDMYFIRVSQKL